MWERHGYAKDDGRERYAHFLSLQGCRPTKDPLLQLMQLMGLGRVQTADARGYGLDKLYKVPFDSGVLAVDQLG